MDEIGKLTSSFNQMAEALRNSEKSMKLAASIYQSNAEAIMVTDENNLIVDINPAYTHITGYTLGEIKGKDPKLMQSGRHDIQFYREMWQSILKKGHSNMARNFGLNVIAEGVETEAQLTFLKDNDCIAFQGYLFSKPVPLEEFESLLNV